MRPLLFIPDTLMEVADLDVRAAYIPDLSDLEGYLHKGVLPIVMTEHLPIYTFLLKKATSSYVPKSLLFMCWKSMLRNVNHPSFKKTFNKLFNSFSLEIVLITESRADAALFGYVRDVLQRLYRVDGFENFNGYYSVLLIWQKSDVYPWVNYRGAIEPGEKFNSTPQRVHPASNWYEDREEDEDGVVHSDNDHLSV
uniref:Uncharacterized protein n=1 Tax=Chenopodium quinoa TaxID=63459 RepID=A0A803KU40_CHEQI